MPITRLVPPQRFPKLSERPERMSLRTCRAPASRPPIPRSLPVLCSSRHQPTVAFRSGILHLPRRRCGVNAHTGSARFFGRRSAAIWRPCQILCRFLAVFFTAFIVSTIPGAAKASFTSQICRCDFGAKGTEKDESLETELRQMYNRRLENISVDGLPWSRARILRPAMFRTAPARVAPSGFCIASITLPHYASLEAIRLRECLAPCLTRSA